MRIWCPGFVFFFPFFPPLSRGFDSLDHATPLLHTSPSTRTTTGIINLQASNSRRSSSGSSNINIGTAVYRVDTSPSAMIPPGLRLRPSSIPRSVDMRVQLGAPFSIFEKAVMGPGGRQPHHRPGCQRHSRSHILRHPTHALRSSTAPRGRQHVLTRLYHHTLWCHRLGRVKQPRAMLSCFA
jgi:hypothetical protein